MLTTIEVYACYAVNIYKIKVTEKYFQIGGRARCAGPGSTFDEKGAK